jgi:glycerol-1-phosphate dehydrogenase [NAD(P)+]
VTLTFPLGDLDAVLAHVADRDPDGRLVPCGLRRVLLGRNQLRHVADVLSELLAGAPGRPVVTLLVDTTPVLRRGDDVKATVTDLLSERFDVRVEVLVDAHPALHADERAVGTAAAAAHGSAAVVTVGGGTMTDIGKLAALAAGDVPLLCVQTAASVDGFTDNVSVVLRSGVKRTVPSRWPDAVLADVETISEAPPSMNRAGFGEITSMFTAPADWRLANVLGLDTSWSEPPVELLEAVASGIDEWSPGVAVADVDAVERLTWALAVRGIATGISGTTACLSGVEHLVSHMLDLHHGELGLPTGLHGAQVGAAGVVAASAWEVLLERLQDGSPTVRPPDADRARADVEAAFGHFGDRVVTECWRDVSAKLAGIVQSQSQIEHVLGTWSTTVPDLQRLLLPSASLARALHAAAAPTRLTDLDPVVPPELGRWAVEHCARMRNRFTVVDLLMLLGWWSDDDVSEVLRRAQTAADRAAGADRLTAVRS